MLKMSYMQWDVCSYYVFCVRCVPVCDGDKFSLGISEEKYRVDTVNNTLLWSILQGS